MKRKSLFLAVVLVMAAGMIAACSKAEYTLHLPTEAVSVTLLKNGDSRTVETAENIENILHLLGGTGRTTAKASVQDAPVDADEEIKIDFIFEEGAAPTQGAASTLFVYKKNGKYYIEQPYNGIYEITQDEYNAMSDVVSTARNNTSIGIIGGADGPTEILVSKNSEKVRGPFGEQYEKKPIRMFKANGELYYDSGRISDMTPRCGTLDGDLEQGVDEGKIPQNDGESNFKAEGYQSATSITKEVPIDGEWVIFKKFSGVGSATGNLKYCFYIKGHLNNAAIDSELVVLTDNKDITFSDVYEPMLSAQLDAGKDNGLVAFDSIVSGDKWGLSLYADDVTKTGMTIRFEQFGEGATGELQTGAWYKLETTVNDEWQDVKAKVDTPVWNSLAYGIRKNDITELEVNWEFLYGELPPGYYRLSKEVMDFRAAGDFDKENYLVHFTIE